MLKVEFDMTSINAQLATLTANVQSSMRPAAKAAAKVFYDEVRLRAPRSEKMHFTKGKKQSFAPGTLQKAIYQAYSDKRSVKGVVESYSVSWNKSKAFYGRFVEFGTSRMPAHSFLRSAYEAKKEEAMQVANSVVDKKMGESK